MRGVRFAGIGLLIFSEGSVMAGTAKGVPHVFRRTKHIKKPIVVETDAEWRIRWREQWRKKQLAKEKNKWLREQRGEPAKRRGPGIHATNGELARIKTLNDLGYNKSQIARRMGMTDSGHNTIIRYLKHKRMESPEVIALAEAIKETEIKDLTLIGVKARIRLHELLDEGKTKPIETVAIMDRSFQQRRLLEGSATEIFDVNTIKELDKEIEEITLKIIEMKKRENNSFDAVEVQECQKVQR